MNFQELAAHVQRVSREREAANRAALPPELVASYEAMKRAEEARLKEQERDDCLSWEEIEKIGKGAGAGHSFPLDARDHRIQSDDLLASDQVDETSGGALVSGSALLDLCSHGSEMVRLDQAQQLTRLFRGTDEERTSARSALQSDPIRVNSSLLTRVACTRCGCESFELSFDGESVSVEEPCRYTDDWVLQFEIDVPSGSLYTGTAVEDLFEIRGAGDYGHGHDQGLGNVEQAALAHAEQGIAALQVGMAKVAWYNTSTSDRFVIGRARHRNGVGVPHGLTHVLPLIKSGGGTVYLMDLSLVEERWKRAGRPTGSRHVIYLGPPGRYRFTHRFYQQNFKDQWRHQSFLEYCEVERVGDVSSASWQRPERTAGQILHNMRRKSPEHHDPLMCIHRMLCIENTSWSYWRSEGYPQFHLDFPDTEPEDLVPQICHMAYWRLAERSPVTLIANGELKVNASMLALARNLLESIITYGVVEGSANKFDPVYCQEQQTIARELLIKLNERYGTHP